MNLKKAYSLIDECQKGMLEIDKNFMGSERILTHEKEQKFYEPKFKELGINASIVSDIYSSRNDKKRIEEIKMNLGKKVL